MGGTSFATNSLSAYLLTPWADRKFKMAKRGGFETGRLGRGGLHSSRPPLRPAPIIQLELPPLLFGHALTAGPFAFGRSHSKSKLLTRPAKCKKARFESALAWPKKRSGWDDFRNFLLETAENVPETGQNESEMPKLYDKASCLTLSRCAKFRQGGYNE